MKPDATQYFVCPACGGDLALHAEQSVEIETGALECGACSVRYPITRGVPRFVGTEGYTDTFGRQWTRWSRTQQDSLNATDIFRNRMLKYTGWAPESFQDLVVVDAGCGPGGFIDVVRPRARVTIGFDMSVAIDSAHELHGRAPGVYLAQGDILRPPIRPGIADRLYTFGVVHHTPDPEGAFRSLIPLVRQGGEIAVWVYRRLPIPQPAYWLRTLTAGMPEPRATRFIEWYVPKAMMLSGMLGTVPALGRYLRRFVPVADYRGRLPLRPEQYDEWALMDTHDMLITRYTFPQAWSDMLRWTQGLEDLRRPSQHEMAVVARRPDTSSTTRSSAAF